MSYFLNYTGLTAAYPSLNLVDKRKKRKSGTFRGKSGTAGQGLQKRTVPPKSGRMVTLPRSNGRIPTDCEK